MKPQTQAPKQAKTHPKNKFASKLRTRPETVTQTPAKTAYLVNLGIFLLLACFVKFFAVILIAINEATASESAPANSVVTDSTNNKVGLEKLPHLASADSNLDANNSAILVVDKLKPVPQIAQAANPLPAALNLPDWRDKLVIVQEWHSWFHAATGADGDDGFWQVWGYHNDPRNDFNASSGALWRRAANDLVYPYLGLYSAGNPEVMRWQIRCMKNAGLDGTMVQMYPDPKTGSSFFNLNFLRKALDIAAEEGYFLSVNDEIQFMPADAKNPDAFVTRVLSVLEILKKHPAALRYRGELIYQYEAWNLPFTAEIHNNILTQIEQQLGEKVFWMVSGPAQKMLEVERLGSLKNPANLWSHQRIEAETALGLGSERWDPGTLSPDPVDFWQHWQDSLTRVAELVNQANSKRQEKLVKTVWLYPGFNNSARRNYRSGSKKASVAPNSAYQRQDFFLGAIRVAMQQAPDIINITSWNDREEKTMLEPSWSNEGSDPFMWLKLIAALKRREFIEPQLPDKNSVDPWMWSILYGEDKTPPRITGLRAHASEATIAVDAIDDLSGINSVRVSAAPWAWTRLADNNEKALSYGCSTSVTGTIPETGNSWADETSGEVVLLLTPDSVPRQGLHLAIASRLAEQAQVSIRLEYPREVNHGIFRLNQQRISTIPPGPALHGTGGVNWVVRWLPNFKQLAGQSATIRLRFKATSSLTIEQIVVFPEQLVNESQYQHALPGPGSQVKTLVAGLPDKLLPRDFFDLPIAVQVFDQAGNGSIIQIVELPAAIRTSISGGIGLPVSHHLWR